MRLRTLRTVFATVLLALLMSLLMSLLTAVPSQAQNRDDYQRQARVVTNAKRSQHDLARFRKQACVQKYARRQAGRMARQQRMFHQDLGVVVRRCNLSRAGENVAYGYQTGRAVVRAWMRSPGHRANLLERRYRLLGLAARRGGDGHWYAVQVFGTR